MYKAVELAKRKRLVPDAYLSRVHLEFPHDLDGHLLIPAGGILRAVDVAEGAITHLLHQGPALEAGILGKLPLALTLLGDDPFDDGRIEILVLLFHRIYLVMLIRGSRGCIPCLRRTVPVVARGHGEISAWWHGGWWVGFGVQDIGFRNGILCVGGRLMTLLLCIDGGHCGCRVAMGVGLTGLFPMANEVLEVLYCRHYV